MKTVTKGQSRTPPLAQVYRWNKPPDLYRLFLEVEGELIEWPKFNKELHELKALTEKWVYFIKNAESLEVVPENIKDEGLKSAYEEANVRTWTQEELDAYD